MFRIAIFVISLLLVTGTIDPRHGWLVALAVLSGLSLFHVRPWRWFDDRSHRRHRWEREFDW